MRLKRGVSLSLSRTFIQKRKQLSLSLPVFSQNFPKVCHIFLIIDHNMYKSNSQGVKFKDAETGEVEKEALKR